jgi:alkylation response protein AidB-like acyl-CoA dehydrogenase
VVLFCDDDDNHGNQHHEYAPSSHHILRMYADIFITAVMTGAPGQNGMSVLLVHKDTPGFSVRKVNIRGADLSGVAALPSYFALWCRFSRCFISKFAGTAYLDFQNARVPLDHLIGPENDGFRIVMYNFNHERFYICAMCVRLARVCMEECIKYALKRKTFGKVLSNYNVLQQRSKLNVFFRRYTSTRPSE